MVTFYNGKLHRMFQTQITSSFIIYTIDFLPSQSFSVSTFNFEPILVCLQLLIINELIYFIGTFNGFLLSGKFD